MLTLEEIRANEEANRVVVNEQSPQDTPEIAPFQAMLEASGAELTIRPLHSSDLSYVERFRGSY